MSTEPETPQTEAYKCEFGIFGTKGQRCKAVATLETRSGYKCCEHHAPLHNGTFRADVKPINETKTPRAVCPHCGAEEFDLDSEGYKCGTEPWYDEDIGSCLVRSNTCYSNQNLQLKSEIERLRSQLNRAVDIADATYDSGTPKLHLKTLWLEQKKELAALKEEVK
jgi:hypothetical protein